MKYLFIAFLALVLAAAATALGEAFTARGRLQTQLETWQHEPAWVQGSGVPPKIRDVTSTMFSSYRHKGDDALARRAAFAFVSPGPEDSLISEIDLLAYTQMLKSDPDLALAVIYNRNRFSDGLLGFEAASAHFLHRQPAELDWEQTALLMAFSHGPNDPFSKPKELKIRRDEVLQRLLRDHKIDQAEELAAENAPIPAD